MTFRQYIVEVLNSDEVAAVNFKILPGSYCMNESQDLQQLLECKGITSLKSPLIVIDRVRLLAVASAVESQKIVVKTNVRFDSESAGVYDSANDELLFPSGELPAYGKSNFILNSLIVHEATHAVFDMDADCNMALTDMPVLISEAAAYITQVMYMNEFLRRTPSRDGIYVPIENIIASMNPDAARQIMTQANNLVKAFPDSNRTLKPQDCVPLMLAILSHPIYKDQHFTKVRYDGLGANLLSRICWIGL